MQRNIARLQKEEIKQNIKEISDQQKQGKKGTNNNNKKESGRKSNGISNNSFYYMYIDYIHVLTC